MTGSSRRALSLSSVRQATATQNHLLRAGAQLPEFVHKWTRIRRPYRTADIALPDEVFFRGAIPKWRMTIGVGGTRSPTVETFCLVSDVVSALARLGVSIISGGVPGVDLAAHTAAIDSENGTTYAVMANPVANGLRGHEWHNDVIERAILRNGGFISEYDRYAEFDSTEYRERLLERDRIISGLSDIFLAFECNRDSATVDTARRAAVQGKTVICVKTGRTSPRQGLDQLIEENGFRWQQSSPAGAAPIVAHIWAQLSAVVDAQLSAQAVPMS